jgi:nucleotidyltransferase substrate binding protein (TIGR01987 family)
MDTRWKQRFQNFEKSLSLLTQALQIQQPDITQKAGLIQFFEITFELAWNMVKDYLQQEGFNEIKTPRSAIKKGFETGLIENGTEWLMLLTDRNLTAHTYEEAEVIKVEKLIREKYFHLLQDLYNSFKTKLHE